MNEAGETSAGAWAALLPEPKRVEPLPGACLISSTSPLQVHAADSRVVRALLGWREGLSGAEGGAQVRVAIDREAIAHADGYRLRIAPDGVELLGGSPSGCFYGLQTLRQWTLRTGVPDAGFPTSTSRVPCVAIADAPDYSPRGLLHDVTRGKVPTLSTLKELVNRMAFLKANQLQLYIEHAFVFGFDPEICGADDGLTPDEIRALDAHCRERFIELVPAVATLGHMGRILSMPKYRKLAEIEAPAPWSELNWPQRARGFTLDCANPEAVALVERLLSDVLDAFSSSTVNIGGDEPWDLGKGKNRERFARTGKGTAYVEHLRRVQRFCSHRGRSVQFWSDVLRNHPHLLDAELRTGTLLHWGYDDKADYEGTALFTRSGMPTHVCPGTSGWKRILNALDLAERNIATFAAAGIRHGAKGMVNTDWGDHGHFNALACSWHGIALGAVLAWNARHPIGHDFDERLSRCFWGPADSEGWSLLRKASRHAGDCETWRLLWTQAGDVAEDISVPNLDTLSEAISHARIAERWWANPTRIPRRSVYQHTGPAAPNRVEGREDWPLTAKLDFADLALACRFSALADDRLRFIHAKRDQRPVNTSERIHWADQMREAAACFAECWGRRNKPSGLKDIQDALAATVSGILQDKPTPA